MASVTRKQYKLKDKKIKLYNYVETVDEMEQTTQGPSYAGEIWAYYRQIGGSEYIEQHKTEVREDAVFVIGHRTDVTAHSIITYKDKVYEVTRTDDYEGYIEDMHVYTVWKKDRTVEDIEDLVITPTTPETPTTPAEDPVEEDPEDGE